MMKRQRGDARDVRYLDTEQFDSGVGQKRRKQLAERLREGQLAKANLIAISHALATLNAHTPPAASIPSRSR